MRCPECREHLPDIDIARFCPTCGGTLPTDDDHDPLIGKLVGGRFRIAELVAEGGMGRIYAADQTMGTTSRRVAIKMLLAEHADREQDVARFMRECSTVCELDHPNTIKFYDYGQTEEGDLFIAMEFLDGDALSAILKAEGYLSAERVDWIISQICGSLQEAHDKGIIHRDLKPDNILLTNPGGELDVVKVLDFGIAKRPGSRDQKLTPLGVVLGSPPYMSPEQFSLQDIDARSDIYSLGVVAYQALTGKLPFRALEMLQWATLHMTEPPSPFDTTEAGQAVPLGMREAVLHALEKEPRNRPQTMREFYEEFTIGAGKSMPPGRRPSTRPSGQSGGHDLGTPALPPPPLEPQTGKSGTMRLPSSVPPEPASEKPVVPELLPPTLRDPVAPLSLRSGGRAPTLLLIGIVAVAVAGGLVYAGLALDGGETKEAGEGGGDSAPTSSSTTAPLLLPNLASALPTAFPTAVPSISSSSADAGPVDPCERTIVNALNGDCQAALRHRAQCAADHPDHALAHRAFNRRCRNH